MALISIMLMIVLMTSLLMMALNISSIEINLASTNRRTTQGLHAGEGGADLVIPVVKDTLALNAIPTYPIASKVVVNPLNTAGGLSAPDFVREMTSGSSPTGGLSDNPKNNPNVTITALTDQTIQVDVDYEDRRACQARNWKSKTSVITGKPPAPDVPQEPSTILIH